MKTRSIRGNVVRRKVPRVRPVASTKDLHTRILSDKRYLVRASGLIEKQKLPNKVIGFSGNAELKCIDGNLNSFTRRLLAQIESGAISKREAIIRLAKEMRATDLASSQVEEEIKDGSFAERVRSGT